MTGFVSKRQAAQGKLDGDTQVYAGRKRGSIALARQLCYEIAGATSEDDDISGRDYGSVDVAEILSAEVVRLQAALAKPVLQDIEQYRMQIAGICTAAIGYWKNGDGIHPDYDTLALRDVAKLYAKYDELYKAQPVHHAVIAGALFDFMAWLTTRDERLVLSGADEAGPAVEAITAFSKMRGLSLDDAKVQDWQDYTAPPQRTWVGLTEWEREAIAHACGAMGTEWLVFIEAVEKALKEKNR